MNCLTRHIAFATITSLALGGGVATPAAARTHHRHGSAAVARDTRSSVSTPQAAQPRGVAGYFGPGAYGPFGVGPLGPFSPGYGYGWYGPPRGDLGFALLGALNGGGFRGFVECGNYYARSPGACGF